MTIIESSENKYTYNGKEPYLIVNDELLMVNSSKFIISNSQFTICAATDPAEEQASPYTYCANNPVMYTDPSGKYIFANGEAEDINKSTIKLNETNGDIFKYEDGRIKTKSDVHKRWWWGKGKKLLYDAANDPNYHSSLQIQKNGEFQSLRKMENGFKGVTPGESFDGVQTTFDGPAGVNVISLNALNNLGSKMKFNIGMTISHSIGEGYTAAKLFDGYYQNSKYQLTEAGLTKLRNDAHNAVQGILPDMPSYFKIYETTTTDDKALRKSIYLIKDFRNGKTDSYKVNW